MSTKIYNAFKVVNVKKPITLNTLSEINKSLKVEAFKIFREELIEVIGRRVWYFQDLYSYYGEDIFEKIGDKDIIACINRIKDSTDLDDICGERGGMPLSNQRIERFIEAIKATFSPDFICIHYYDCEYTSFTI